MTRLEDIIANCLESMERGRSVEDCLGWYPQWRGQLEPLLRKVERMRSSPQVAPSPAFRGVAHTRMLNLISHNAPTKPWRVAPVRKALSRIRWPFRGGLGMVTRFSLPLAVALLILISTGVGGGVVYASGRSLPGDFLYPVKLSTEQVRLVLSPSERGDTRLHLSFAGERVREAIELTTRGRADRADVPVTRCAGEMQSAIGFLRKQAEEGEDIAPMALLLEELNAHLEMLARLSDQVPESDRPAIRLAMASAAEFQRQIEDMISGGMIPGAGEGDLVVNDADDEDTDYDPDSDHDADDDDDNGDDEDAGEDSDFDDGDSDHDDDDDGDYLDDDDDADDGASDDDDADSDDGDSDDDADDGDSDDDDDDEDSDDDDGDSDDDDGDSDHDDDDDGDYLDDDDDADDGASDDDDADSDDGDSDDDADDGDSDDDDDDEDSDDDDGDSDDDDGDSDDDDGDSDDDDGDSDDGDSDDDDDDDDSNDGDDDD